LSSARQLVVYRWLLRAYPAGYRRDFGEAATQTFADVARAVSREDGWWGLARLWAATVPSVVAGGLAERWGELRAGKWDETERADQPPWLWATAAAVAVFGLYVATLARTTAFWDASEYIATAHIVGIPHPPGNPAFVLLARAWEILLAPLGLSVAVRINLFSAFMSAAAHGLWFLVVHQVLSTFDGRRAFRIVGAACAVLVSATAFTVWSQSNVNEKVYTVSLFTIALLSWLALRWQAKPSGPAAGRLLVLMAFVLGLSVGNHLMAFLAAPALVLFVVLARPRTLLLWRLYPALLVAGMAGLTVHLFLPIRAGLGPVINEGAPLCDSIGSALASVLSYGQAGCEALGASLAREQYQKPPVWDRLAPFGLQLVNYVQYFDWQWARAIDGARELLAPARLPFTALFTALGIWGAMEHRRRDPLTFWYAATLFATLSLALTFYMNFEHGYSFALPEGAAVEQEVRERDYFFIVSFSLWGLWAGMGIAALWLHLSRIGGGLVRASPALLVAGVPLVLNAPWADRSDDWAARDYAYNLLQSVEPYSVLFTGGDNDTFPLWYLQEVEGVRRDVQVVVTSYMNTAWYAKQVRDLTRPCDRRHGAHTDMSNDATRITCQRAYQPGPDVAYAGPHDEVEPGAVRLALDGPIQLPVKPIMDLDDDTVERIAATWLRLEEPVRVRVGSLEPTIPGDQIIEPWHQYALAIVDTALSDARPVYWSNNGTHPASLGLREHLVRQGVAFKLHDAASPPPNAVAVSDESRLVRGTGAWIDGPRTKALVDHVFVHRSGLPEWDHWPDHSTVSIPYQYAWAYYALAVAEEAEGRVRDARRYAALGDDWSLLTR
jgi:hypothetical protein